MHWLIHQNKIFKIFRGITRSRMSNSSDLDQARRFVGPDMGPDCLQSLYADGNAATSRKRVYFGYGHVENENC